MGTNRTRLSSLATTIQGRLQGAPRYSEKRCIFRVPPDLRQVNEEAFTPMLVSIGPLHFNDKRLLPMEAHKLKSLQFFLGDNQANAVKLLNSCLEIIKDKETEIRECYADPITLSSDDFTQMVLIDSAFIIHFFNRILRLGEDDYMLNQPFLKWRVFCDMKLEENQLPFFILEELFCVAFKINASNSNSTPSFAKIVCRGMGFNVNTNTNQTQYYHLLHLFACHRLQKEESTVSEDTLIPTATQLHEAGVKFQVSKDSSSLLDIAFDEKKGILTIPRFVVHDTTECDCRNLIAFEQCNYDNGKTRSITDYHYFMDCLINTPEDVQLLIEADIIRNFMGSPKQVSDLINSLNNHACLSSNGYYYGRISSQLQDYCKKRWNRYRATLMHDYFNHPWAIISVIYAIVLLFLTIAQVVAGFGVDT